ncbi:MAG: hypothetical protein AB1791_23945 [Chloroflexota bacterium]
MNENANWKARILVMGVLVGAAVGLGAAYLLARAAEEQQGGPPTIKTMDAIKAAISVIGVVRGIASLGEH